MRRLAAVLMGRGSSAAAVAPPTPVNARREIGDEVLIGHGYEFGAGLLPSRFAQVESLTVIDKRTPDELAGLFGARPEYPVVNLEEAAGRPPLDFVTAHHVVEHLPDPIGALSAWIGLLRQGGTLFLSVPSANDLHERLREVTPISHLVMDYLLRSDGTDFESRQHVHSFIQQWTAVSPDTFWFSRDGLKAYAEGALAEQRRTEGHDLHWHTFSLDTFMQTVEAAFYVAGCGVEWGQTRETEDELHVVARKTATPRRPDFLAAFSDRLSARLSAIA